MVADSSSADRQDFSLAGSPATIPGDETFTLDVEENEDVGPEELVLMATIAGEDEYGEETEEMMLGAITFVDGTTKQIEPKGEDDGYAAVNKARKDGAGTNELWTPGETLTLKAEDLFDWPDTTTSTSVRLSNAVSEDTEVVIAVTSNDVLTITAKSAGMTEVSVTATVVPETSSFVGSQTVSSFGLGQVPRHGRSVHDHRDVGHGRAGCGGRGDCEGGGRGREQAVGAERRHRHGPAERVVRRPRRGHADLHSGIL